MLLYVLIISFALGSIILFGLSAKFWFPLWRSQKEGTAHALFLTNVIMGLAIFLKLLHNIFSVIDPIHFGHMFDLVVTVLVFSVSVFQFALSRGYFNSGEVQ